MTDKNLISYLKKSFFTGSFKTIVVTLSTIIFLPLIISRVGMETYGLISLTMLFGGMVIFADFGISKSVTLLIGQDKGKKNVNDIVTNAFVINLSLLFLIGVVLYLLVLFQVPLFESLLEIDNELKNYIVLLGFVSLCIMLINNLLTAILEAYYLMHYVNIGFMLSSILINILIYVFSILFNSIYIILLAPPTTFLIVTIYFLFIINHYTTIKIGKANTKQTKKMLSISYKYLNIGLVNSLVIPANKYFIIYITGNSSLLGIFDIALKIAFIANSLLNSIAQPLFGVFSNINQNKQKIFKISVKVSSVLFFLYIIGNIIFFFVGLNVVTFIDKLHAKLLFKITFILLIGVSFTSVSEPFYRALLGTKRLKAAFIVKLLIPILNIMLYLIFTETLELDRFAYSYALSTLVSSLIIIIFYLSTYKKVLKV